MFKTRISNRVVNDKSPFINSFVQIFDSSKYHIAIQNRQAINDFDCKGLRLFHSRKDGSNLDN
ncbi:MAG: hypothetical protein EPGJADBJ_01525 [Saprospiraceae bacterium]|nr:hypothetical protein [Saprospiraceae bacterium]